MAFRLRSSARPTYDPGRTAVREIALGAMDRVNAEVLSGLAEGDRVVVAPASS